MAFSFSSDKLVSSCACDVRCCEENVFLSRECAMNELLGPKSFYHPS